MEFFFERIFLCSITNSTFKRNYIQDQLYCLIAHIMKTIKQYLLTLWKGVHKEEVVPNRHLSGTRYCPALFGHLHLDLFPPPPKIRRSKQAGADLCHAQLKSWAISEKAMKKPWTTHEQFIKYQVMNQSKLLSHEQAMCKSWTSHEQVMNKSKTSYVQVINESWACHEQVMNKRWASWDN